MSNDIESASLVDEMPSHDISTILRDCPSLTADEWNLAARHLCNAVADNGKGILGLQSPGGWKLYAGVGHLKRECEPQVDEKAGWTVVY